MMLHFDTYLKFSLIAMFWCVGFFLASEDGKILEGLRRRIYYTASLLARKLIGNPENFSSDWYNNKVSKWTDRLAAPLIGCCPCMASAHSTLLYVGYLCYFQITPNWWNIVYLLIIILTVTVLNTVLIAIINLIRSLDYIADKMSEAIEKEESEST